MDSKDFQGILDRLNGESQDELIFVRPLKENIDVARGWTKLKSSDFNMPAFLGPNRFYLIRSPHGNILG